MNDENELLEPLATEAGQEAIVRAIRDISSLEYAVRAEQAASTASAKAGEASQSAIEASEAEDKAKDWATKTDTYVEQETITIPPEQEGEEPTTETINLYSAKYYAALAQDIYNNMSFDSVPTENSTNMVNSGTVYSALDLKADKINTYTKTEVDTQISTAVSNLVNSAPSTLDTLEELADALGDDPNFATTIATQLGLKADKSNTYTKTEVDTALNAKADQSTTYTKTEVDTALSNVQSTLTFDNVPTANSDNPVKSSGIKTALDGKQDTLTFDSTPTANSTNPVTSGGVYTALQNANIEVDDEITEDSDNPVTSAAIYNALQNFTPSGGGGAGNASGFIRDLLYENSEGLSSGTITLNKSWKDYDFIEMDYNESTWAVTIPTYHNVNKIKSEGYISAIFDKYGSNTKYFDLKIVSGSDTQLTVNGRDSFVCRRIYGIKFSKNLSEQMYSNVLYENASGVYSGTITLNDNFDNYDFISFEVWDGQNENGKNQCFYSKEFLQQCKENDKFIISIRFHESQVYYKFTNLNTITFGGYSGNCKLYKIIGYKMAKGGYSGIVSDARMTVKSGTYTLTNNVVFGQDFPLVQITFDSPMPDDKYEVSLTKHSALQGSADLHAFVCNKTSNGFQIKFVQNSGTSVSGNGVDWIAIRPNSYTREGMVEDVLFSNASGVNSGTINLSGNISDYDLICFVYNTNGGSSNLFKQHYYINSSNLSINDKVSLTGYDNRYIDVQLISDSSLSITGRNEHTLIKIIGIKFGRYVSGVAVDTTVTQNSNAVVTSGAVYDALQNIPSGGGSGSSITIDSVPTENSPNAVSSGGVYTALANKGDVTTNTDQNITGTKTFVGSKKVAFKQSTANDKLGFTLYGNTGTERGYLEFNPTNTVDGVTGLMTLGNYATSAAALTQVGFRRYSNISGASGAYNLLMPMVADARTPFSLTTTYQNFYLPLGFTDGTTTVKTAKSGLVDLSPLLASLEARVAALEGN